MKTPKIPAPKTNSQKILWWSSETKQVWFYCIQRTTQQGYVYTTKDLQIVLDTPKKSLLKSNHLKKNLPNFPPPPPPKKKRNPGLKHFKPKKILWLSLSLEIQSTMPVQNIVNSLVRQAFGTSNKYV